MQQIHGKIPNMFDYWANPVVHLLQLKSSMPNPDQAYSSWELSSPCLSIYTLLKSVSFINWVELFASESELYAIIRKS